METTPGGLRWPAQSSTETHRSAEECAAVQSRVLEEKPSVRSPSSIGAKRSRTSSLVPEAMDRALRQRIDDRAARRWRRNGGIFELHRRASAGRVLSLKEGPRRGSACVRCEGLQPLRLTRAARDRRDVKPPMRTWETSMGDVRGPASPWIPGKDALGEFNRVAQERYSVNVGPTSGHRRHDAGPGPERVCVGPSRDDPNVFDDQTVLKPGQRQANIPWLHSHENMTPAPVLLGAWPRPARASVSVEIVLES